VRRTTAEDRQGLELTSWRRASVDSEYVNPAILETFAATFAPCGFRREAFASTYALTEAGPVSLTPNLGGLKVLRVEKAALQENRVIVDPPDDVSASYLVSSGVPIAEKVVIVDPKISTKCPPGRVGEIWVSSRGTQGYWNKPDETESTFKAFLADTQEGPFVRTGDLGFLDDGEVFVTGRLKDLIIMRGRNIYPQDVEITVEKCHSALGPNCTVAFSIQSANDERLVLIQELHDFRQSDLDEITETIRQRIFEEHDVLAYAVVLVKAGSIPKAPNGKLQRQSCREKYIAGELNVIETSITERYPDYSRAPRHIAPRTPTEKKLAEIWCAVLAIEKIGIYDNFVDLGGHSILAIKCLNRVRDAFAIDLPPTILFAETANVRELAEIIDKSRSCGTNI